MKYDLIVTDLDDTLLRSDLTISPRAKAAIKDALDAGIHVAFATGRMFPSAVPYAKELGLTGPIICCQGAHVADIETGKTVGLTPVKLEDAQEVLRFAKELGEYIQYYSTETYFFERVCEQSEYYVRMAGVRGQPVGDMEKALDYAPVKLLITAEPEAVRAIYEKAAERFAGRLFVSTSRTRYIEFTHPDANKGAAVAELIGRLGIERTRVMAMGDALNDLPMLEYAGLGVAMGNASPAVQVRADVVTATNDEDGAALAIEQYALKG